MGTADVETEIFVCIVTITGVEGAGIDLAEITGF